MHSRLGIAIALSLVIFVLLSGIAGPASDLVASAYESLKPRPTTLTVEERLQALSSRVRAGTPYDSLMVEAMGLKADAIGTEYADSAAALFTGMQDKNRKTTVVANHSTPAPAGQPAPHEVDGIPLDPAATIRTTPALLKATVEALRSQGYRCDSVTGIFTAQFSSKMQISIYCNGDAYHYKVTENGGLLVVDAR